MLSLFKKHSGKYEIVKGYISASTFSYLTMDSIEQISGQEQVYIMRIKAFLADFDGTLVYNDMLDVLCGINGKEEDSRTLNEAFIIGKSKGLLTLKRRIDFLAGVTLEQIKDKLDENNYLIDGAKELFSYLAKNKITTVLHSGNITPVLQYYQKILNIDYVLGTTPRMNGNVITGIELSDIGDIDFKALGCRNILNELEIDRKEVVCLGDSPSDSAIFSMSAISIAINPKGNIAEKADYVIHGNLRKAIDVMSKVLAE